MSQMQALWDTAYLASGNAAYVEQLYEQYLANPDSIDKKWRDYFQSLGHEAISHAQIREHFRQIAQSNLALSRAVINSEYERKQAQVAQLIDAYRSYGHYHANLDPLGIASLSPVAELELSYHHLSPSDLETVFNVGNLIGKEQAKLKDIYQALRETYCGNIGIEYMHISDARQTRWIQERIEANHTRKQFSPETKINTLKGLLAAEGLEKYLGSKYVGQKRFSLEGGESLIPLIHAIIQRSARYDVKEAVIGMAHRGRLNVLINVMGKAPNDLFEAFEGKQIDRERSGDVKYHLGFSSDLRTEKGKIHLALAFNPSHLEIISPVVAGSVRARQERRDDKNRQQVLPIQIHGDAAFAGQGVVMETFNISQVRGYTTGGSIHIVVNNQVGFTTSDPRDARSTLYCTDVAKMVQAPIFHVNGDDPESVLFVAHLAIDYRMTFNKDVVIDLVCYRRHGHNEADEPSATQPVMYQKIKQHPTTVKLYAERLIAEKVCSSQQVEQWINEYRSKLDQGKPIVDIVPNGKSDPFIADWTPYLKRTWDMPIETAIPLKELTKLAKRLETLPPDFMLQPQVAKMMEERRKMTEGVLPLNWGYAETLAYASLIEQGYAVRLSGQDSGRGTFAHRHAILYNQNNGEAYIPLRCLSDKQANFSIIDSVLSEEAVLAFEYGFATADPKTLVIWEAQFGDFVNGAQVVIDQFISSGEQKWGRLCGLTLLLPHGFEGAGPEHSSARLERFLQLCAQYNMQVCIPSTPAQCFHMLRRQILRPYRKPLIVMTPKSLLRHKLAVSKLEDLTAGKFLPILPEIDKLKVSDVKRVILCSGKVYYDLLEQRRAAKLQNVAIVRIEQLYPFPVDALQEQLEMYKKAKEVIWCQEEPKNQGAWYQMQHRLLGALAKGQVLSYAGRPASASPAVGSVTLHQEQQTALVQQALAIGS